MNKLYYCDTHRYDQTGYSAPTIWPQSNHYTDKLLWIEDYAKAEAREANRQDWLEEEAYEARMEYREQQAETKAEREEHEHY